MGWVAHESLVTAQRPNSFSLFGFGLGLDFGLGLCLGLVNNKLKENMMLFYIWILSLPCSFPSLYLVYRCSSIEILLHTVKKNISKKRLVRRRFFGSVFNKHIAVFFFHKGKFMLNTRHIVLKITDRLT